MTDLPAARDTKDLPVIELRDGIQARNEAAAIEIGEESSPRSGVERRRVLAQHHADKQLAQNGAAGSEDAALSVQLLNAVADDGTAIDGFSDMIRVETA